MNKNIKFLFNIFKKNLLNELVGLFFTIIYTVAVLLAPYVSKYLVDNILLAKNFEKLGVGIFLFFFVCLVQPTSAYVKNQIFFIISEKITFSLRDNILKKLFFTPMAFFDKTPKGMILSRMINDSKSVSDFITNIFVIAIKDILLIIALLVGMFFLSWKITLLILMFLIALVFINLIFSKKFKSLSKKLLLNNDDFCKNLEQSITNTLLIKTFCLEDFYYRKNFTNLEKAYQVNIFSKKLNNLLEVLTSVIVVLCMSVIYGFGSFLVFKNEITLGTIFALGLYFQILIEPLRELIAHNIKFQEVTPVIERIHEYLNLDKEFSNLKSDVNSYNNINDDLNSISFNNVCFYYDKNENVALRKICFTIDSNGLYGLVGRSGCGKTTVTKLLLGLYQPYSGNINVTLNGKYIFSIDDLRRNISYISQESKFINGSIIENLRLFNKNTSIEEIKEICSKLDLNNKINNLPNKYYSILKENINLSEGEKQRLNIARGILKKAPIIIFDEATSALDKKSEDRVFSLIEELSAQNIIICITHKMSILKKAKKIIVLDKGNIAQTGTHLQLSKIKGIYRNVLLNGNGVI